MASERSDVSAANLVTFLCALVKLDISMWMDIVRPIALSVEAVVAHEQKAFETTRDGDYPGHVAWESTTGMSSSQIGSLNVR